MRLEVAEGKINNCRQTTQHKHKPVGSPEHRCDVQTFLCAKPASRVCKLWEEQLGCNPKWQLEACIGRRRPLRCPSSPRQPRLCWCLGFPMGLWEMSDPEEGHIRTLGEGQPRLPAFLEKVLPALPSPELCVQRVTTIAVMTAANPGKHVPVVPGICRSFLLIITTALQD